MLRRLIGLIAILVSITAPALALDDSRWEDSDRQWGIWGTSQTNVTSYTADPAGIGSLGANVAGSTTTDIFGYTYTILSLGSDATYKIAQTTKTWSSSAGSVAGFNNSYPSGLFNPTSLLPPSISTSVAVMAPSGVAVNGEFRALTRNPRFIFSNLSTAATLYITVDYWTSKTHP